MNYVDDALFNFQIQGSSFQKVIYLENSSDTIVLKCLTSNFKSAIFVHDGVH